VKKPKKWQSSVPCQSIFCHSVVIRLNQQQQEQQEIADVMSDATIVASNVTLTVQSTVWKELL
jgi:hypothetical protein